ncbi:MAG: immunity 30 family protein [Holosporaceae bacterium]|nr:immunity 30 family protein [Holosporaceae bacterium]
MSNQHLQANNFESELCSLKDTDTLKKLLPDLFCVFDDNCNDKSAFSLIHLIETVPDPYYVECFLKNLRKSYTNSVYWTSVLFTRIMNNSDSLQYLKYYLYLADRETLLHLLSFIENDRYCTEEHKRIISDLRKRLGCDVLC